MNTSGLFQQINYEKAYRKNRLNGALWVLKHPETLQELLGYCFSDSQDDLAHKATWVLEFVCLKQLPLIYPHLNFFFSQLSTVKKDQSVRPLAHICELLTIAYYKKKDQELNAVFSAGYKNSMTECAFDWLITDQKVACQVRAMTALYFLGTEYDWIHPELKTIIEQNIHEGSPGYKARGKSILNKIQNSEL